MNKHFSLTKIFEGFKKAQAEQPSDHASTKRFSPEELLEQWGMFSVYCQQEQGNTRVLDALHSIILVLNSARQILFANKAFLVLINMSLDEVRGLRVGEAVGCKYALESINGCGTCLNCTQCPAVNGQLKALEHGELQQVTCSILTSNHATLELEINYTPLTINGNTYLIASALDIQEKNHRELLERTTLHDLQNSIGALSVFADELLPMVVESSNPRILTLSKMIRHIASIATDELQSHGQLVNLEVDAIRLQVESLELDHFLNEVVDLYATFPWARHAYVIKVPQKRALKIQTDATLLKRVISNMLKNACEAEAEKDRPPITISWGEIDEKISIAVHNHAIIPPEISLQLFRKFHSTKGKGRGVGTFSIKVLTERYLGGNVVVDSHPERGTTFKIILPLTI